MGRLIGASVKKFQPSPPWERGPSAAGVFSVPQLTDSGKGVVSSLHCAGACGSSSQRGRSKSEPLKSQAIRLTTKILFQGAQKNLVVRCSVSEQSHRGSKL